MDITRLVKRFQSSILGAGYLAVLPLTLNAVSVFATAYIVHGLGPLHYGQWAVAASLTATSAFLANLGLRPIFVRRLAETPADTELLLSEQLGARLLLGLCAASVALAAAVALQYGRTVVLCTAIAGVGLTCAVVWTALGDVLQAQRRFGSLSIAQFVAGVCLTAASVVAVHIGAGPVGIAVAYLIGPIVTVALLAAIVRHHGVSVRLRCSLRGAWALLHESRHLGLQQFVVTLRNRADELLVPKLVGIAEFGYFSAGTMPSDRASIVPDGVATAFYPTIASACGRERDAAARTMLLLAVVTTVPLSLGLIAAAPMIARLLFPGGGYLCRLVMQLTAISIPIAGVAQCAGAALQASGRHEQAARAGVAATVSGALVSVVLISHWGLVGAAYSWVTRAVLHLAFIAPHVGRAFPTVLQVREQLSTGTELQPS